MGCGKVSASDQPQNYQGARPHYAAIAYRSRRQGDRIRTPFAAAHESVHGPSLPFVALQRHVGEAGMSRPNADFAVADALAAAA
jgi:hypothetical protein